MEKRPTMLDWSVKEKCPNCKAEATYHWFGQGEDGTHRLSTLCKKCKKYSQTTRPSTWRGGMSVTYTITWFDTIGGEWHIREFDILERARELFEFLQGPENDHIDEIFFSEVLAHFGPDDRRD
jgi:hypothetical protein